MNKPGPCDANDAIILGTHDFLVDPGTGAQVNIGESPRIQVLTNLWYLETAERVNQPTIFLPRPP
jgi:hypothetical protein